jgi:hypothetical protein
MRLVLTTLLALLVAPGAAAAQQFDVVTGPAEAITPTSATLTGTIDPDGSPRTYHFEIGSTTAYGLQTPEQATGSGAEPETVKAGVSGLSPATTYHSLLVADGVSGGDRTFTTPALPGIARLRVADKTATSARLSALVDPNGAATTWYVEWGASTSFGNRTPEQTLPTGTRAVPVSVLLEGLPSHRRIHWRVVATNVAGVKRSGRTSFTTLRAPTGITLGVSPPTTTWNRTISLFGTVRGAGVNGLTVSLQQSSFPFDGVFHEVATARTNRSGLFRFAPRPVFLATQFRAVPQIAPQLVSSVRSVRVRSRVRVHRGEKTRRAVWLTGAVNPGLPTGEAVLQRRRRTGGWRRVAALALTTQTELRSTYAFKVRRKRTAKLYRVRVAARDGGAHARGYSRSISVGEKQRKRRR